jgi:two-component system, NarL family, invasion response regulator UvrY
MKKVLLAEDHGIVIMGVQIIFETDFRDCILDIVKNSADLMKAIESNNYELVIVDLELEDGNTLPVISNLLRLFPKLNILIFSGNAEELYAQKLYTDGVKGYLIKQNSDDEVIEAIRTTMQGNVYMSEKMITSILLEPKKTAQQNPFEKLSYQEMQVATLMQLGKKPSEICCDLNLQSSTVATYKMKVFSKLNISNVLELKQLFINYQIDGN